MIDIENATFTNVYEALNSNGYEGIKMYSSLANEPAKFPCVYMTMMDSYTTSQDSSRTERLIDITFDISVFSASTMGKKAEAKAIMAVIDDAMRLDGFKRTYSQPLDVSDKNNTSLCQLLNRYEAQVDDRGFIHSRR